VAFVLDAIKPIIRSSAQLERELNLRPIVAIPAVPRKDRRAIGRNEIKSLIDTNLNRLSDLGVSPPALLIGGGAAVLLMVALAAMA
jgi:hypothetical protein